MSNLLQFPSGAARRSGLQAVQATYTLKEISRQFGLSETVLRRWTLEGLIPGASSPDGSVRYTFSALKKFRRVREMRAAGMSLERIGLELRGQLNLFEDKQPGLLSLPVARTPFEEGLLLYDAGDVRAAQFFRKAIAEQDCPADAWCNLGILAFRDGKTDEAFDCLTKSLKEDPRHFESHYNLANLYLEIGDHRLAKEHYTIAAAIEPNFPNLYFNLGLTQTLRGELAEALASLRAYCKMITDEQERAPALDLIASIEQALSSHTANAPA